MTTFNRTYRAPKFFLCVHTTQGPYIGFEIAKERFTHFSFLCNGSGRLHALIDKKFEVYESNEPKKLIPLQKYINCNVVGECEENTRMISFNSWKKSDIWKGRILTNETIQSSQEYSCVICLEGSCIINGNQINELEYADLEKNKQYSITICENSYVGFFELCL